MRGEYKEMGDRGEEGQGHCRGKRRGLTEEREEERVEKETREEKCHYRVLYLFKIVIPNKLSKITLTCHWDCQK